MQWVPVASQPCPWSHPFLKLWLTLCLREQGDTCPRAEEQKQSDQSGFVSPEHWVGSIWTISLPLALT